jgi:hypothetical protein
VPEIAIQRDQNPTFGHAYLENLIVRTALETLITHGRYIMTTFAEKISAH